jgi:uncharacterized protein (TIGR03083 family)
VAYRSVMTPHLDALRSSVARLRDLVRPLDDTQLEQQAYPTEWRIADVLSHLGSGAVITTRRLDDVLAGNALPDDFAPTVWDEWNAKSARKKAGDALAADQALMERLDAVSEQERSTFSTSLGPLTIGFDDLVGLRLNEHGMHTWDVEVTLDPAATLHPEQTALIIDNLGLIGRYTAKPTGSLRTIAVRTTEPARDFVLALAIDSVTFSAETSEGPAQLVLPAEAFARLLYGRLDPDHTPPFDGDAEALAELRRVFPGP